MPQTDIRIYEESPGQVPLLDWLDQLPSKVQDKCYERIESLSLMGNELRRPLADYLDNGVYELRVRARRTNYRMLYAFAGKNIVLLSHGCTKTKKVPENEIDQAIRNLDQFKENPEAHTYSEEL